MPRAEHQAVVAKGGIHVFGCGVWPNGQTYSCDWNPWGECLVLSDDSSWKIIDFPSWKPPNSDNLGGVVVLMGGDKLLMYYQFYDSDCVI